MGRFSFKIACFSYTRTDFSFIALLFSKDGKSRTVKVEMAYTAQT